MTYRSTLVAMGPVSYWRLGETGGIVAIDTVSTNHGIYINTPTLGVTGALAGDSNAAVTFTRASSEKIDLPTSASLHPGDVLSLVFWAKRTGSGAGGTHHIWDSGFGDMEVFFDFADKIRFARSGVATIFESTAATTDTAYHMYAFTKNGATIGAYKDGAVLAGTTTNSTLAIATGAAAIAGTIGGANFFDGTLDEPAIWDRALSATEIGALYTAGIIAPTATTFRQDITSRLVVAIDAFITANPTLLRRSESARPPSVMGDFPLAFVDGRQEQIAFDSGIRERIMTPSVVVVSPLADNVETVTRHDVLVDALVDHFTTYAQLATNTIWDRMTVADEDYAVDSADGTTRHFFATRFTFNNVSIMEGRN